MGKKSWKLNGAEWVLLGCAVLVSAWALPWVAPLALIGFGAFKWLFHKEKTAGIMWIAAGVLGFVVLKGALLSLLWPVKVLGGLLVASGAGMMLIPSGKSEETEELGDGPIIEIENKEKP